LLLLAVALVAGCDDGPRATSDTSPSTSPAIQPDTGARASGGVFETPSTQPASR